jgi:ParB-like nuclease domain
MQIPNPALLPNPALFDVTTVAKAPIEGSIERVELDALELAPNARREISREGIERLAGMLMRTGQLVPCIGHRPDSSQSQTVICDGQRRLLAAQASGELAGVDGYEGLTPVKSLIVLLLDHEPSADEIRRIQAQANQRESLSLVDQQEQLRDCWEARVGLPEPDRIVAVCADLGISPKRAHNLRRQLALPDPIRTRVAERPIDAQVSVTMANRLADMHEIAPQLTQAVAKRITSTDLHDKALQDLGAFVHRTVVEDEHTYAVRIDDGSMLDAAEQIEHARAHLTADGQRQTGRHEPRQLDAIVDAELERALADPDPLRGIAQLTARWAAAFVLDPAGVTRTKALGSESMARKLRDALPGGEGALRAAVWEFMRPMLSPALASLNRDAFVIDQSVETTVDLDGHRGRPTLTNSP